MAPAAPLTLPSPPKGRGRQERAPRAGMTAAGRPAPACHPRAWPLHGGRDARRVRLLFLIPLPRRGRGSRRRPERSASGVEGRGGTYPGARGGASSPPHPSLSPQGERETRTSTARGNDSSGWGVLQGIWLSGCMAVCMSANLAGCGDTTAGCAVARGGLGPANGRGCRGRGGLLLGGARGSISEGQGGLKRCG